MVPVVLEEFLCGVSDALLLADGHTFRAAAMSAVVAITDFCKNQCLPVHHDQVNFTKTAVVVAFQCPEPALVKERFGKLFPLPSLYSSVIQSRAPHSGFLVTPKPDPW